MRLLLLLPVLFLLAAAPAAAEKDAPVAPPPAVVPSTAAAPGHPLGNRRDLALRIEAVKKQIRTTDERMRAGNLPKDEFSALQELRTNLDWERRALEDRLAMMDRLEKANVIKGGGFTGSEQGPEPAFTFKGLDEGVRGAPAASVPPRSQTPALAGFTRFAGRLPCADCWGIDTELDLYSEGRRYVLRERYDPPRGGTKTFVSDGVWTAAQGTGPEPGDVVFELNPDPLNQGKKGSVRRFLQVSDDELKLADFNEADLKKPQNMTLRRVPVENR